MIDDPEAFRPCAIHLTPDQLRCAYQYQAAHAHPIMARLATTRLRLLDRGEALIAYGPDSERSPQ